MRLIQLTSVVAAVGRVHLGRRTSCEMSWRERVWAARANVGPQERVLMAALDEATLSLATRRREIGGRECDNI